MFILIEQELYNMDHITRVQFDNDNQTIILTFFDKVVDQDTGFKDEVFFFNIPDKRKYDLYRFDLISKLTK